MIEIRKCFAEAHQEFCCWRCAHRAPREPGSVSNCTKIRAGLGIPSVLLEVTHPKKSGYQDVLHLPRHICSQSPPFSPCTGLSSSRNIKVGVRFFLRGWGYMGELGLRSVLFVPFLISAFAHRFLSQVHGWWWEGNSLEPNVLGNMGRAGVWKWNLKQSKAT